MKYRFIISTNLNVLKSVLLLSEQIETENIFLELFATIHVFASCGIRTLVNLGDYKQKF